MLLRRGRLLEELQGYSGVRYRVRTVRTSAPLLPLLIRRLGRSARWGTALLEPGPSAGEGFIGGGLVGPSRHSASGRRRSGVPILSGDVRDQGRVRPYLTNLQAPSTDHFSDGDLK